VAAGPKLDGAGRVKLKTLDEAALLLQRIHGLVESYAMAVKRNQAGGPFLQNIRRTFPVLGENLKSQFGLISDQIAGINLQASRGASEGVRVRVLREGVAQIKQALEIAMTQTKDEHAIPEGEEDDEKEQGTE
jgi:hypothetical protein